MIFIQEARSLNWDPNSVLSSSHLKEHRYQKQCQKNQSEGLSPLFPFKVGGHGKWEVYLACSLLFPDSLVSWWHLRDQEETSWYSSRSGHQSLWGGSWKTGSSDARGGVDHSSASLLCQCGSLCYGPYSTSPVPPPGPCEGDPSGCLWSEVQVHSETILHPNISPLWQLESVLCQGLMPFTVNWEFRLQIEILNVGWARGCHLGCVSLWTCGLVFSFL